jgi:tetratricopeptide (TPR) repeat protein
MEDFRMIPNVQMALNQQFQQGCYFAQQAMAAEQMGNILGAAQCFDQAIATIANSMAMAGQHGIPVTDSVLFSYAICHFNAARVKSMTGFAQFAPMHLAQAHEALRRAIDLNPGCFQYYSAAGVLLLAEGNVAGAMQSLQRAVQLNPMDSWSQWMLASLYQVQGNAMASNQYYAAAAQIQPNLPPPQQFVQQHQGPPGMQGSGRSDNSGKASQHDWVEMANNAFKLGNSFVGLFQGGGEGGGQDQQMNWNQGWNQFGSDY